MEFQKDELNEILNVYQQESTEIIASMDSKLLTLEKEGPNQDIAIQLFRDAHSLKGSARMLGFEDIQNIAHKIEDIISLIKEDKLLPDSKITDTISECLEFIAMLIKKTVEQGTEYKNPDIQIYIEKLDNLVSLDDINKNEISFDKADDFNREILLKIDKIDNLITDILYIISKARLDKDFSNISKIKKKLDKFISLFNNRSDERFIGINSHIQAIIQTLEDFKKSDNKDFSFLEVNEKICAFVGFMSDYFNKEHIPKKDYYELAEAKLKNETRLSNGLTVSNSEIKTLDNTKHDDILNVLSSLELSADFYDEFFRLIDLSVIEEEKNNKNSIICSIYAKIKELIEIFHRQNVTLPQDVSLGVKNALEALKSSNDEIIKEAKIKIDVIKTMADFQSNKIEPKKHSNIEQTQKDILNTITNSEIKTLRIDSVKLDNLVGQIGELIVSKIKTNEQLLLAKKINNDLIDWQKNFVRMNYYIKYFGKKYLSDVPQEGSRHYGKVISYNRQLAVLGEQHQNKIVSLIKDMSVLFRQIQESETKLNATTSEIESMVKNMRILPLSTIFQLFPRMVHNIARDNDKKIDLVINGADVTVDKTIIEEIKIPLMHIIRNSIDHGIEKPHEREQMGKNPIGKIEISASYKDDKVLIDVKDDGRGLDVEKIKSKALEKNLLTKEEINAISDDELTNLIFYPGFSTEDFITELSGRGLGLDIVNNKISQLQGRVDVFSEYKQGTVVRLVLPATVATKEVFIIEEQNQLYAIETSAIKTIARINADEVFEKDGYNYYIHNGIAIVVHTLSQILNFENTPRETAKYTLLIIETDNITFGIIVEKLISDQEIVHKKLAPPLYKIKNISGIATLASGDACLILNVSDIITTISSKKDGNKIVTKSGILQKRDNYKYKILVVDDSHTTRMLQKNILSNKGYNVITASNPIIALEMVNSEKFDFVVSDIEMPEMNGFEFIAELRKIKEYENIPVVIISSDPKEMHTQEIEENNIKAYIEKSMFRQNDFLDYIENALN